MGVEFNQEKKRMKLGERAFQAEGAQKRELRSK